MQNSSYQVYCTNIPQGKGLGTAKLFMGVARNEITVSIKDGTLNIEYAPCEERMHAQAFLFGQTLAKIKDFLKLLNFTGLSHTKW